jgi:hypothetical protein
MKLSVYLIKGTMKKVIVVLILTSLALISCSKATKENESQNGLPECIEQLTDDPSQVEAIKRVLTQTIEGETHYWLNTDAMHYDGSEVIVNNACDTLCLFCGECLLPPCASDYTNQWETIWER